MCVRVFVMQQIPDSNLLMLVVQADCDCSRQYPPITMEPNQVKYILSHCYTGPCCGVQYTGVLSHKNRIICFALTISLTQSHIMPRLNVTG